MGYSYHLRDKMKLQEVVRPCISDILNIWTLLYMVAITHKLCETSHLTVTSKYCQGHLCQNATKFVVRYIRHCETFVTLTSYARFKLTFCSFIVFVTSQVVPFKKTFLMDPVSLVIWNTWTLCYWRKSPKLSYAPWLCIHVTKLTLTYIWYS